MMKKCNMCNTDNPIDAKYCRWCGCKIVNTPKKDIYVSNENQTSEVIWKIIWSILIIGLAIWLICTFNLVGKTGVIVGGGYILKEIWKDIWQDS